jgi:hypothetical protein
LDDGKGQHDQDSDEAEHENDLFASFQFGKGTDDITGHYHEDKYGSEKEGKNNNGNRHFDVHKRPQDKYRSDPKKGSIKKAAIQQTAFFKSFPLKESARKSERASSTKRRPQT